MELLIFGNVSITLLDLPGYAYAYAHTHILSGFAILGMHTGTRVFRSCNGMHSIGKHRYNVNNINKHCDKLCS